MQDVRVLDTFPKFTLPNILFLVDLQVLAQMNHKLSHILKLGFKGFVFGVQFLLATLVVYLPLLEVDVFIHQSLQLYPKARLPENRGLT